MRTPVPLTAEETEAKAKRLRDTAVLQLFKRARAGDKDAIAALREMGKYPDPKGP